MKWIVKPSKITGVFQAPASKSQTFRALIFASLAKGTSKIYNYLDSEDTTYLINNLRRLGATIAQFPDHLEIKGTNSQINAPQENLYVGNSGICFRFLCALAMHANDPITISGDKSISSQRPIDPLCKAIKTLGGFVDKPFHSNAPIRICGPINNSYTEVKGNDSQFVSALLIALAFRKAPTTIYVKSPGEIPWVNLTLQWLDKLKIRYKKISDYEYVTLGNACYEGFIYTVPSDLSSATYPLVSCILSNEPCTIENIDLSIPYGDSAFFTKLKELGLNITINHLTKKVVYTPSSVIQGGVLNINDCIDCVTLFATLGCFCSSPLKLTGAQVARTKECDRLFSITKELRKMGAKIDENIDCLTIYPSELKGCYLQTYEDHRMALSLAVAAMHAREDSEIENVACVEKTYRNFAQVMQLAGANIDEQ